MQVVFGWHRNTRNHAKIYIYKIPDTEIHLRFPKSPLAHNSGTQYQQPHPTSRRPQESCLKVPVTRLGQIVALLGSRMEIVPIDLDNWVSTDGVSVLKLFPKVWSFLDYILSLDGPCKAGLIARNLWQIDAHWVFCQSTVSHSALRSVLVASLQHFLKASRVCG